MIDLDGGFYRGGLSVGRAEGIVEGSTKTLNKVVNALKELGASADFI